MCWLYFVTECILSLCVAARVRSTSTISVHIDLPAKLERRMDGVLEYGNPNMGCIVRKEPLSYSTLCTIRSTQPECSVLNAGYLTCKHVGY